MPLRDRQCPVHDVCIKMTILAAEYFACLKGVPQNAQNTSLHALPVLDVLHS